MKALLKQAMKALLKQAMSQRFESPAARDFVTATTEYDRLKYEAEHLAEMHRRIRQQTANLPPALRTLRRLQQIDAALLDQRRLDAAVAKDRLKSASKRYRGLP